MLPHLKKMRFSAKCAAGLIFHVYCVIRLGKMRFSAQIVWPGIFSMFIALSDTLFLCKDCTVILWGYIPQWIFCHAYNNNILTKTTKKTKNNGFHSKNTFYANNSIFIKKTQSRFCNGLNYDASRYNYAQALYIIHQNNASVLRSNQNNP